MQRTLRRQVKEYVRYTNRRSVVEDFTPSPDEQALYDDVSEYLRRSENAAIEPGKRTLLTLVYRKLLACSTFAIAPTLRRLAESLEQRLAAAKLGQRANGLLFEPEETSQLRRGGRGVGRRHPPATLGPGGAGAGGVGAAPVRRARRADHRQRQGRGPQARPRSRLHRGPGPPVAREGGHLHRVAAHPGVPRQAALSPRLGGQASPSSPATPARPRRARRWSTSSAGPSQILLSTEAGAEGLNLQFCNLVVNFDLPWNPQRVEQRIGRCHRYGQQRDVLVLNFLNRSNAADARLFELLERKLNLFDGVFGASDEILGALESGVDFERRVLDIYQSCRLPEEIDAAFDALRKDLESHIDQRMTETRAMLLERFDGDVRKRLRVAGEAAKEAVSRFKQSEQRFTGSVLGTARGGATADAARRQGGAQPPGRRGQLPRARRLDPAPELADLNGKEGWWYAYRFKLSGLKPEEKLVHVALVRHGEGFRLVPMTDAALLPRVAARDEPARRPPGLSASLLHEQAILAAKDELLRAARAPGHARARRRQGSRRSLRRRLALHAPAAARARPRRLGGGARGGPSAIETRRARQGPRLRRAPGARVPPQAASSSGRRRSNATPRRTAPWPPWRRRRRWSCSRALVASAYFWIE